MPAVILLLSIELEFPTKGITKGNKGIRIRKKEASFSSVDYIITSLENLKEPSDNLYN